MQNIINYVAPVIAILLMLAGIPGFIEIDLLQKSI